MPRQMLPRKLDVAIVITYLAQQAWARPACEQSGYCSLGLVQPFFGDIFPSTLAFAGFTS